MSDALPEGIHQFLGDTEWEGAEIAPLVGDASFRRYFRLRMGGRSAMLMHAPPPHEAGCLQIALEKVGEGREAVVTAGDNWQSRWP